MQTTKVGSGYVSEVHVDCRGGHLEREYVDFQRAEVTLGMREQFHSDSSSCQWPCEYRHLQRAELVIGI